MSSYKKHIFVYLFFVVAGIAALTYYHYLQFNWEIILPGIVIGTFYTLLPDIDTPSSKLRGIIAKLSLATTLSCLGAYLYLKNINLIYISLALVFFLYFLWFSPHRRIFHTLLVGVFLSSPWYLINPSFFLFALSGFLVHLMLDGKF